MSQSLLRCVVYSAHTGQHQRGAPTQEAWTNTQLPFSWTKQTSLQDGIQPSHLPAASCDCHMFCLQRTLYQQAWERTLQPSIYIYLCNTHLNITRTFLSSLNMKRGREEEISGCCGVLIIFIYLSICLKYQRTVEMSHGLCQELNWVCSWNTYFCHWFPTLDKRDL